MKSIVTIASDVARLRGVALNDILSTRRTRCIIQPRQEAFYFARELTTASLPLIGRRLGNKDHTTVLNGWQKIGARVRLDERYAAEIASMGEEIRAGLRQQVPLLAEHPGLVAAPVDEPQAADVHMQLAEALERVERLEGSLRERDATIADLQAQVHRVEDDRRRLARAPAAAAAPSSQPTGSPQRVLAAFKTFETERFGRGEALAFNRLMEALTELRADLKKGARA